MDGVLALVCVTYLLAAASRAQVTAVRQEEERIIRGWIDAAGAPLGPVEPPESLRNIEIIVGSVAGAILVAVAIFCCCRRKADPYEGGGYTQFD